MNKFYFSLFILATLVLVQYSCTKMDVSDVGTALIPIVDNVNTFDTTLEVITDNMPLADTTAVSILDDHALGHLNDPDFGVTYADVYAHIVAPQYGGGSHPFYAKDSVKGIDSVVLMLAYKGIYGDSIPLQNYTVSEIDLNSGFKDSLYKVSTAPFTLTGGQLANQFVDLTKLKDTVLIVRNKDTSKVANVMRIRLNNSIGQKLASFDTTTYKTDSAFRIVFKGLAIKAGNTGQALAYFNLTDANSKLVIYYRAQKNGIKDTALTTAFSFVSSMQANLVKRTPGGAYAAALNNGNPSDPNVYIQSAPGSFGSIKIPGLKGLGNRLVYRAELIIERDAAATSQNNLFGVPPRLFLDAIDSANNNRILAIPNYDITIDPSNVTYNVNDFGGLLGFDDTYRFNITRFVQGVIAKNQPAYTLRLHADYYSRIYYRNPSSSNLLLYPIVLSSKIGYGRVVVKGGNYPDPKKKMRLRIIYSKI